MLDDDATYDELKLVALTHLVKRRCTECSALVFIWQWHFVCAPCGRKLGYDMWLDDESALVISDVMRGNKDGFIQVADWQRVKRAKAWQKAHGLLSMRPVPNNPELGRIYLPWHRRRPG